MLKKSGQRTWQKGDRCLNIFTLSGEILLSDHGVESRLDSIDSRAQKTHKSFSTMVGTVAKWGAVLGAAATAGLGLLGKSAIEGASSLEGYRNTLNVVMKDTKLAGETFAWAVDFANKTPFETESIVQATVRLTSYGLKAKEVMPAIGDMAGVMNKDIMEAVEAVADAQTGELERMKEFGITKQMIIDQGNKIMKGKELVNSKGQIVDQENFNKAMFSLMDEKFKGGMELQANSFKGLWSTVTGVFKTSLAMMMGISKEGEVVVGGMFDTIKGKVKILADLLTKWSTDGTIDRIGKVIQTAFGIVSDVFMSAYSVLKNKVLPAFKEFYDWIEPHIPTIQATLKTAFEEGKKVIQAMGTAITETKDFIIKYWDILAPILAGTAGGAIAFYTITAAMAAWTFVTKLATAAQLFFNAALLANPMTWVVIGIGLLIAAGVALYMNWDTVKGKAGELWHYLKESFTSGVNACIGVVNNLIRALNSIPGVNAPLISTIRVNQEGTTQFSGGRNVGTNAAGTDNWRGGLTWVGEQGPELLNLPKGSQITSNKKSMGMGQTLNFNGTVYMRDPNETRQTLQQLQFSSAM